MHTNMSQIWFVKTSKDYLLYKCSMTSCLGEVMVTLMKLVFKSLIILLERFVEIKLNKPKFHITTTTAGPNGHDMFAIALVSLLV